MEIATLVVVFVFQVYSPQLLLNFLLYIYEF